MYKLDNEHVVKLYSHFEEKDAAYLIMELTEGVNFSQPYIYYCKGRGVW